MLIFCFVGLNAWIVGSRSFYLGLLVFESERIKVVKSADRVKYDRWVIRVLFGRDCDEGCV